MLYIGIDLGTSAVKLLLMDEKGQILRELSREYPLEFPRPGWSQQNPEDWKAAVWEGIPALLEGFDSSQVAGIGAGGQMHGLVVLDDQDQVIRPAILWNDGRTAKEVDYLNETVGRDKLSARTANIAFAGFTAPKLLWMRENEPELFARIRKIMLPKDYINYVLTGIHCTDYSDASGMLLLDVEHKRWSAEMLALCHIAEDQLPRLYESYEPVGTLLPEAASQLGLPESVVVCAGAGDNAAAAVGTGTVGDGACNISLGTSGTLFISSGTFGVDPHNALHAFAHADGHYHLMGCMLSAASCNKWWMDGILGTGDYAGEQKAITDDRLGNNHVFFLPYLMGERSPINDTNARGALVGMTMDTSRADLTQAVLEGVAFAIRDSFEVAKSLGIPITRSMICGGGAKSPLWKKIMANVLNIPLDTPVSEQGPGMGGAMLAMVACGAYPSVEDVCKKLVRVASTTQPDPEIAARYEARYRRFQAVYPALKPIFPKLNLS
ncbi:xylulokinase [Pseudoflavonifractor phocaeensis]|uniref:xylulokinase n=1 Tax=Pseudoflavonifractor phocaeensis TaxID=1870988 RepID=UPI001959C57C|nr:xylulokinase [Pseudoflavonifractor phocaeensis]MBM6926586.1 xylulokinase [Pseudoflavonifractor phocaeensis]